MTENPLNTGSMLSSMSLCRAAHLLPAALRIAPKKPDEPSQTPTKRAKTGETRHVVTQDEMEYGGFMDSNRFGMDACFGKKGRDNPCRVPSSAFGWAEGLKWTDDSMVM